MLACFASLISPSKATIYLKFLTISVEYFEGGRARGPEGETNSLQNAMQQEDDDRRSRRHPQSSVSKGECGSTGEGERERDGWKKECFSVKIDLGRWVSQAMRGPRAEHFHSPHP